MRLDLALAWSVFFVRLEAGLLAVALIDGWYLGVAGDLDRKADKLDLACDHA
jgi:hypothetical protein